MGSTYSALRQTERALQGSGAGIQSNKTLTKSSLWLHFDLGLPQANTDNAPPLLSGLVMSTHSHSRATCLSLPCALRLHYPSIYMQHGAA